MQGVWKGTLQIINEYKENQTADLHILNFGKIY